LDYPANPFAWVLLSTVLTLMAGLVLYVTRLNLRLRHSKQVLENEIGERYEPKRNCKNEIGAPDNRSEPECVKLQTLDGIC